MSAPGSMSILELRRRLASDPAVIRRMGHHERCLSRPAELCRGGGLGACGRCPMRGYVAVAETSFAVPAERWERACAAMRRVLAGGLDA